jgi:hypothetical protein
LKRQGIHRKYRKNCKKIQKHLDKSTSMGYNGVVVIRERYGNICG